MKNVIIDCPDAITFAVEGESRTIRGLAVPFGKVATSDGQKWQFAKGVLSWAGAKLLMGHKWDAAIGTADFTETDEGLELDAGNVARTVLGDEALELAASGTYSGLSIGLAKDVKFVRRGDVNHVISGTVREVSITPIPAFTDAAIRSVAAQAEQEEPMKCDKCGQVHADGVTECTTTPPAFSADEGKALTEVVGALTKTVEDLSKIKVAVPDLGGAKFEVKDPGIYRFDGIAATSGFDFSTDFISAVRNGDSAALERLMKFTSAEATSPTGPVFVDTADTAAVNPATYRPDLFKDEAPPQPTPMYDTFYAGAVTDMTPFFYSKLGAYSGMLDDHVEGVEPDAGEFSTVAGATITPRMKSGRMFITREVIDQGGNPQVSGLIWTKWQRTFRQMLEGVAAAALKSKIANYGTLATPAVGADGRAIGKALKAGLVDLQYTSDGQRFTKFFAAKALYAQLSDAEDDMGRPLYPILSPSNADGSTSSRLGAINVAGIKLDPTWSTGPGNISFYADPTAVRVWNSGLTRLDKVKETAAGYAIDVWSYVADHVYDETGVLTVDYAAPVIP